jgi:ketosteroid isomerase-like protein
MRKKNGINIMLFVFIFNFLFILSCTNSAREDPAQQLLQADRDFSKMSVEKGMFSAFLFYISEDGIILRDNAYPSEGREALRERFSGRSDTSFVLAWEPLAARIAESGDLGFTYGIHSTTIKATGEVTRGTYVTIWKKQSGGSWKFILDTGTEGLPDSGTAASLPVPGQRSKDTKN